VTTKVLVTALSLTILVFPLKGGPKETSVAGLALTIVKTAQKYHYMPRPLNDSFSVALYGSFLKSLDPSGTYFTVETVRSLDRFKYNLDDQILQQKTVFLDTVTELYVRQLRAADSLMRSYTGKDIDLSVNDTLWMGGDSTFGKLQLLGRKREQWLKYLVLWSLYSLVDTSAKVKMPAKEETLRVLNDVVTRELCRIQFKLTYPGGIKEYTGQRYLKAIASTYDPHSTYMSFAEKNRFETELSRESGSFGLKMNFNMAGEVEIVEVVPGGPAWNSGKVNEDDVILDIKNPNNKTIDLRCALLSDVYNFLSSIGDKPTVFKIRKKNGAIISVSLKKALLDVDQNILRSFVLKGGRTVGYVYLPSFYTDFTYGGYFSKGCANDLAKELIKLKRDSLSGLILDIRSNGGGAMDEALRIAGIFIDHGALCISHCRGNEPETVKDNARGAMYNGPLVVLVNYSSASASELLAGVLQDYNRALIVGSQTFGKGTIQNVLPVDAGNFDSLSHYKGEPPGYLTVTTGGFFRVTGLSHQKTGIKPDVELPQAITGGQCTEASYTGALALTDIRKKTYYYPADPLPVAQIKAQSSARVAASPGFTYARRMALSYAKQLSRRPVPLGWGPFSAFLAKFNEYEDSVSVKGSPFTASLPSYDKSRSSMTDTEKAVNDTLMRSIGSDLYINEAFAVINDLITCSTKKGAK
jgi:carboxyl-terminal processing protease